MGFYHELIYKPIPLQEIKNINPAHILLITNSMGYIYIRVENQDKYKSWTEYEINLKTVIATKKFDVHTDINGNDRTNNTQEQQALNIIHFFKFLLK